jgi:hypothetical protein
MATIPSPRTWSTGDPVRAAYFQSDIHDAFEFLLNVPLVHVSHSTGQTGSTDEFLMEWDTEDIDTDGMFNEGTSASRLTIQTAGLYEVILHIDWEIISDGTPSTRMASVQKNNNGGVIMGTAAEIGDDQTRPTDNNAVVPQSSHLVLVHNFVAGDYIEAVARCTDTSDFDTVNAGLEYLTFFAARWIGSA